jgi:Ni,Fe-hydrogenase III large subunit
VETEVDHVRDAMLQLAGSLRGGRATVLVEAIGGVRTLGELCDLRRPLVQALTTDRGELQALRQIMRVDAMLLAAWPEAPVSRPAVLG